VILDVAGAEHALRVDILELGEQVGGAPPDHLVDDGQPAAMAHRRQRVAHLGARRLLEQASRSGTSDVFPSSE